MNYTREEVYKMVVDGEDSAHQKLVRDWLELHARAEAAENALRFIYGRISPTPVHLNANPSEPPTIADPMVIAKVIVGYYEQAKEASEKRAADAERERDKWHDNYQTSLNEWEAARREVSCLREENIKLAKDHVAVLFERDKLRAIIETSRASYDAGLSSMLTDADIARISEAIQSPEFVARIAVRIARIAATVYVLDRPIEADPDIYDYALEAVRAVVEAAKEKKNDAGKT